jgi:hypothetical protein
MPGDLCVRLRKDGGHSGVGRRERRRTPMDVSGLPRRWCAIASTNADAARRRQIVLLRISND